MGQRAKWTREWAAAGDSEHGNTDQHDLGLALAAPLAPAPESGVDAGWELRLVAAATHLASLLNFLLPTLAASATILALRLLYADQPFVRRHTRAAFYQQVLWVGVLLVVAPILFGQLYLLLVAIPLALLGTGQSLWAALLALAGREFRYFPASLVGDFVFGPADAKS